MRGFFAILALVLLLGGGVFLLRAPPRDSAAPGVTREGCLECHDEAREGPGGLHSLLADCEACHLGDPSAHEADRAHFGLEREPGALDTAARTCGRGGCHPSQLTRVQGSLMATTRGLIAVDRWAFGELSTPTSTQTAQDVLTHPHPSPAQDHLRRLCLGCHLGTRKHNRDDMLAGTASGCSACHSAPRPHAEAPHPAIDRAPPDQRCFGCHSRSARISLSYQGWHEVRGAQLEACAEPIRLTDGRDVCQTRDDVHHAAGLACVDCHLHTEVMGDGVPYAHEEEQVELRCQSCHGPAQGLETTWGEVQDGTSQRLLALNGKSPAPDRPARTGRRGTPLWNLEETDEGWSLSSKLGAGRFKVTATPADAQHTLRGHERLECSTCHSAWAPRCPTCHTSYDPAGQQWDFGRAELSAGRWVEDAEAYFARPPTLAQRADRIVTAAPGMIATLDARATGGPVHQTRWFAAFDPHTTVRKGRTCVGCHLNPVALGLGEGTLKLRPRPRFLPASPGAPAGPGPGGWQALFQSPPSPGTRPQVRGLSPESQWRALRVAACLPCHPNEKDSIFSNFPKALARFKTGKVRSCRGWDHPWLHTLPKGSRAP